jgi:hypothetical protein
VFEFLFCPQHGLFRPENVRIVLGYGTSIWFEVQIGYVKLRGLFGRFL